MNLKHTYIGMLTIGLTAWSSEAAAISWGTNAFEISTAADIDISGRQVVYAVNGGDAIGNPSLYIAPATPPTTNVKTVTIGTRVLSFEGVGVSNYSGTTFGPVTSQPVNVTFGNTSERGPASATLLADFDRAQANNPAQPRTYEAATGNAGLDSVLASQVFSDARNDNSSTSSLTVQLKNLTPATAYQVQIIAPSDGRTPSTGDNLRQNNVFYALDPFGAQSPNIHAFADLNGDLTKHVTSVLGNFTADASTQNFSIQVALGRNPGVSAIIVTAVPEPTVLAAFGCLGGLQLRRNRQ